MGFISTGQREQLPPQGIHDFAPPVEAALAQLAKVRDYARDVQCDCWEFAVEIERLISLGVTAGDLRWLVKRGYIVHAREVTGPGDPGRRFERAKNLAFPKETCFSLGDTPLLLAQREGLDGITPAPMATSGLLPHWDCDDHTLYLADRVVKKYRRPSPNQEAVLAAFEEEGWPHYVDDPLSPVGDQSPKQRLRDTIKCLNAKHKNPLIRFRGDGTGERVGWELIDALSP